MSSIALGLKRSHKDRSPPPQRTCCLQGSLTEQKKPYGSACDKLKCVMCLLRGVRTASWEAVGEWEGALMISTGVVLTPLGLTSHSICPRLHEVKGMGLTPPDHPAALGAVCFVEGDNAGT